jgi:hypothetical protein
MFNEIGSWCDKDINTIKTGHVTITVQQASGVRFKTLAKNVEVVE